jgi:hypothetical protein
LFINSNDVQGSNTSLPPAATTTTTTVTLEWGGLTREVTLERLTRLPAASATATILSRDAVASSDPSVRVEFAVRDAYGGAWVSQTNVTARVVPEVALLAVANTPINASCVVDEDTINGACALSLHLPDVYFDPSRVPEQRSYSLTVMYSVNGGAEVAAAPVVFLSPDLALNTSHGVTASGTVALVATTGAFGTYPGQMATMNALASSTHQLSVFTVVVHHDEALVNLVLPVATDARRWALSVTRAGSRTVVSGTVRSSYSFSSTAMSAPEPLFELTFQVAPSAPSSATSTSVNVSVIRLVDHLLGEVCPPSPPSLLLPTRRLLLGHQTLDRRRMCSILI